MKLKISPSGAAARRGGRKIITIIDIIIYIIYYTYSIYIIYIIIYYFTPPLSPPPAEGIFLIFIVHCHSENRRYVLLSVWFKMEYCLNRNECE